jgi:hypothetical protein
MVQKDLQVHKEKWVHKDQKAHRDQLELESVDYRVRLVQKVHRAHKA